MTEHPKKKLIEVGLPLDAINKASGAEKSVRHGHPSTMHLWWSRKPLAVCRAVLFAQLVDDPSARPDLFPTQETQNKERERLFGIIESLVPWKNTTNHAVMAAAHAEVEQSMGGLDFTVLDPFCGGGSVPLEAQRLGLRARGSDLNPIAVLLGSALVDYPARFLATGAVNPEAESMGIRPIGPVGLAVDIRHYGQWMRQRAFERIRNQFPNAKLGSAIAAWIWARSMQCPNPACRYQVPLVRNFLLAKRSKGSDWWVEPHPDPTTRTVRFEVRTGTLNADQRKRLSIGTAAATIAGGAVQATFVCPVCQIGTVKGADIDAVAANGGLTYTPVAAVVESSGRKVYVSPAGAGGFDWVGSTQLLGKSDDLHRFVPTEQCRGTFASNAMGRRYGFETFADYFTPRQQLAMATFLSLLEDLRSVVRIDAIRAGVPDDSTPLEDGGRGSTAYADAIAAYIGLAIGRSADYWSTLNPWVSDGEFVAHVFSVQGIAITWGFAEVNPFSDSSGNWLGAVDWIARAVEKLPGGLPGEVVQHDAMRLHDLAGRVVVCTDPPYYDNISYAVLADYFYVWLRRGLRPIFPSLFSTTLTPKEAEIVATDFIKREAVESNEAFFRDSLREAFARIRDVQDSNLPMTVFYAYNDADDAADGATGGAVGWETMLSGLLDAGFGVVGAWPLRTQRATRPVALGANALASSILLVCRPRPANLVKGTTQDFITRLRADLPGALRHLHAINIAPVDLAQAIIGPGMAVLSKFERVLKADGKNLTVGEALATIDSVVGELQEEAFGETDPETRWAVAWYDQHGFGGGSYDDAQGLARPKGTTVDGLERSGIVIAKGGRVRLKTRDELPDRYEPEKDLRATAWEATQHLVKAYEAGGEQAAALVLASLGARGDAARELAYRLFEVCRRRARNEEAIPYNAVVASWAELDRLSRTSSGRLAGI